MSGTGTISFDLALPLPISGLIEVHGEQEYAGPGTGVTLHQNTRTQVTWAKWRSQRRLCGSALHPGRRLPGNRSELGLATGRGSVPIATRGGQRTLSCAAASRPLTPLVPALDSLPERLQVASVGPDAAGRCEFRPGLRVTCGSARALFRRCW